ncbi:metal-dependent hydrolase [Isachenkonia alkalipeptolytica]|uniref:Metal-dependent hydrolase n=1 Tax=Isachenkonia alkalipeptolytica TaxID=2565777 RepID=A0AA43XIB2_9CLOT|nr:metal-dependent hydrolase [Isachenkonia alkalipeptolytica]NBG87355.1 metal-dependent hydrolase [Isachenkonia alkalipeptolytica]
MMGRTHAAFGVFTVLFTATIIGLSFYDHELNVVSIGVALLGALLPDMDMGGSSLSKGFGVVKADLIEKIWFLLLGILLVAGYLAFENTPIFHGILFMIFMGFVMSKSFAKKGFRTLRNITHGLVALLSIFAAYYYHHYPLAWVGFLLLLLLISNHRGLSHSLLFLALVIFATHQITTFYGYPNYSVILGIGMGSHIFSDMFTKQGLRLFWPLDKKVRFPFYIKTGGKLENFIFLLISVLVIRLGLML